MSDALRQLLAPAVGLLVIALLVSLGEAGAIELGETTIDSSIIAIFAGIASALIIDISTRNRMYTDLIRNELKRGISDTAKVHIVDTESDAYVYLANRIPNCRSVRNTIIHSDSYSDSGVKPESSAAKKYTAVKRKYVRSGKGIWQDAISISYIGYIDNIKSNWIVNGKSLYSAWTIDHGSLIFSNYTILEYTDGSKEVVLGWIVESDAGHAVNKFIAISNIHIVNHYDMLFDRLISTGERKL